MARPKTTASTAKSAVTEEVQPVIDATSEKKTVSVKEPSGDTYIPCRSVTGGELICKASENGETYHFSDYGDVTEITYSDLNSLRAKKSAFIFDPCFIIEDEDILELPRWKEVKKFYESMYGSEDIDYVLELPNSKFKAALEKLPKGLQRALCTKVASQLEAGTFDSLQKIKILDEVCGTDFGCLLK